ncbi:MAG: formate dehydrogenase accessory sulfurtransferase FdhD, partial [Deltaproteobacteria bacterium]|nr:formate dehydrogenase accessory sulfurtransferase FdhD [Deltaproteobacteria bacterium]
MKRETETKAGEYGRKLLRFDGRRLCAFEHAPVREFPLPLHVNGVELATLIASPHDLHYLVAGFLRMQGMVERLEDLQVLSVCQDSGMAHVRIRGEVPGRIRPTLTSGCGSGITFHLPRPGAYSPGEGPPAAENVRRSFPPETVFAMMENLSRRSEQYREHGGIHSAAVGDGATLLLHAEDLGRHNTLDRIAGEALLKGIDLGGKILVTSGRVSSEMAAKGASLGVALIASRTSPTDLAVRICEEAGITLVGYVRGRRFTVYTHPY